MDTKFYTRLSKNLHWNIYLIILLSAITDCDFKNKGFSLGAVDYITKPFEISEVKARVKTQLRLEEVRLILENQNCIHF